MSKVTQVNINEMIPGGGRYYRAHAFRFAIFALLAVPVIISLLLIYLNPFWFRESFGQWICDAWTPVGRWIRYRAYTIYLGCDPKVWEALNKRNN
jgi:hypothetical protein